MATSPSDKLVQDQEVGTEEVDPVKTTEKEDKARTEEDEVRTEEQEVQTEEEAIESLLASTRNLTIQDAESDQGTENHNPQEQSMIRRSGQRMERGSTSSSRDQNQNRPLVLPNPPPSAQTSRQMMMMPPRLGPSVPPYQQDPFGLPQPRWLVVDHFYSDGLGLYGALWRFRTITPFLPNQNTYPHQLVPMELPGQPGTVLVCYSQSFGVLRQGQLVPHHEAPPMRPQQNQFRSLPPMRPMLPQDDFVVNLGQVPVRPMMYYQEQNQIVPNAGISQPPLWPSLPQLGAPMMQPPVLLYPPPIVNAVPVRPVMNQGGQRFRFPMIQQHQGSPSAPWPEQNQQLQSPRESQGSNDGPFSSGGSQD
ncbi:protein transport protein SEC31-like [Brassica napus]|nr:protein transport protein SEC31-like [Brassica napus]